jgi:hypothetical protein
MATKTIECGKLAFRVWVFSGFFLLLQEITMIKTTLQRKERKNSKYKLLIYIYIYKLKCNC